MIKAGKVSTLKGIMLEQPNLPIDGVLNEMKRRGLATTKGFVSVVRNRLRQDNHKLPNLATLAKRRGFIVLNTKMAAVMKEKYYNPKLSNKEISQRLEKKGIKVSPNGVSAYSYAMRPYLGAEVTYSPRSKPVKLTEAQIRMIPTFNKLIGWALHKEIFPKMRWPLEQKKECSEFVKAHVMGLVAKYDGKRMILPSYIAMKTKFLVKDFIRKNLAERTGLKRQEVNTLIKIIRETARGEKDLDSIAKKIGVEEKEAKEIWDAYQLFLKIEGRTGKRAEEMQ